MIPAANRKSHIVALGKTPYNSYMDDEQKQDQPNPKPQASPPVPEQEHRKASPEETKQELQDAIRGSNEVLASCTTVLTLFPDTLTVDRAKLTITRRSFFSTAEVISMRIEDISNVTVSVGPFFGNVKIVSRVMNAQTVTVGRFRRDEAIHLKRIAQGYVIALQREIDCSSLPRDELVRMLDQLGEDEHAT